MIKLQQIAGLTLGAGYGALLTVIVSNLVQGDSISLTIIAAFIFSIATIIIYLVIPPIGYPK